MCLEQKSLKNIRLKDVKDEKLVEKLFAKDVFICLCFEKNACLERKRINCALYQRHHQSDNVITKYL